MAETDGLIIFYIGCMVDSVVEYFQNNRETIIRRSRGRGGIQKHIHDCT
jgi:hypothetical protein